MDKKGKSKKIRITVDLTPSQYQQLVKLTDAADSVSHAHTVRLALRIFDYLAQSRQNGCEFLIKKGDKTEAILFLALV